MQFSSSCRLCYLEAPLQHHLGLSLSIGWGSDVYSMRAQLCESHSKENLNFKDRVAPVLPAG